LHQKNQLPITNHGFVAMPCYRTDQKNTSAKLSGRRKEFHRLCFNHGINAQANKVFMRKPCGYLCAGVQTQPGKPVYFIITVRNESRHEVIKAISLKSRGRPPNGELIVANAGYVA
jgi:hypothetical protein